MESKKGFTFIEIVIYSAVLAIISVLIVNSLLLIIKTFNSYRVSRFINTSAASAMERMVREIRQADDINPTSILNSNPSHLVLDSGIEFFNLDNQLTIKENNNDIPLISGNLQLTNLIFKQVGTSTNPISKAIKIEMTLEGEKFYNTVILRGSYGK